MGANAPRWSGGQRQGLLVGLMAWLSCRDFIRVLDGCSACAGRAAVALAGARLSHASPEMGSDQLAPLPLHCPWGGSECHPEYVTSGSKWGEGPAGRAETRWAARATGETPRRPVRPPRVPTRVPRAAGAPCMSSQPRAWSIRGQWGRWGGGRSGDRECAWSSPSLSSAQSEYADVLYMCNEA